MVALSGACRRPLGTGAIKAVLNHRKPQHVGMQSEGSLAAFPSMCWPTQGKIVYAGGC